ncbi:hypothetical protein BC831DRAFT_387858, partial [Entophlyctis helioformis]
TTNINWRSNVSIPSVSEEVWKNPWHPLKGPPRNYAEQELLSEHIKNEKAVMQNALSASASAKRELERAAADNCADLAYEYQRCVTKGGMDAYTGVCFKMNERLVECMAIQSRNMERLGFLSPKPMTYSQRLALVDRADDMYLQEM